MSDHLKDQKAQIFDLTLMSNFVHQVVNPLNAVCGTLDNIAKGDVPVGSIKQRVRASRSQIEYCIELIPALFFQEMARKKNMKIHLSNREIQYRVRGDSALLRQVFINVFDNCVKYGRQSTDITVNVHIQKTTNDLMIEIINVGDQVPRDLWERIFEAGFRGENARQLVATGTGLGLYICRSILAVYKGAITYRARANSESIFTIRIPEASI
jgi:K+-sensing histidine kinase KdpD